MIRKGLNADEKLDLRGGRVRRSPLMEIRKLPTGAGRGEGGKMDRSRQMVRAMKLGGHFAGRHSATRTNG